ncbi:MAG: hypothetical protein QXV60_02500 [Nitrososphaerota archaeon]
MKKSRILYLISGIIFLIISIVGGSWWEFIGGEISKPFLYIGLSPFDFKFELLGLELIKPPPFMIGLFLCERLLAIIGSITIIVGSLLYNKTWSRRLFNLRPFTIPVVFIVIILIGIIVIISSVQQFIPIVSQVSPNLKDALMPYSNQSLTINLYPILYIDATLKIKVLSQFTFRFWIALLSGLLCLAASIIYRKEAKK